MVLDNRQSLLLEYVKQCHGNQKRKYTGEPYWKHVYAVAEIVHGYEPTGIEIALCHDLLEDTACTEGELRERLVQYGYDDNISFIIDGVVDLTDEFTTESYPQFNRKTRKQMEAKRLGSISYISQTVKYADLIHNSDSIVEHDQSFARIYLSEKQEILENMKNGNTKLLQICRETLNSSLLKNSKK